jgi:hypothetical protein
MCRLSWTLTPNISTMVRGFLGPPSTLLTLAEQANIVLPAFVDAVLQERAPGFPQVLLSDSFQTAHIVAAVIKLNKKQLR